MSLPPSSGGQHPFQHPQNPLESHPYQYPPSHRPFEPLPAPRPHVNHRRHLTLTLCTLGVWGLVGWVPLVLWRRASRTAGLLVTGYFGVLVAGVAAIALGVGGMASGGKGSGLSPNGDTATPDARPVLTDSGDRPKHTAPFRVDGPWQVKYTFDCSALGYEGNFAISLYDNRHPDTLVNLMVNVLDLNAGDVVHQTGNGTYFLAVDTQCNWSLEVDTLT
jgi:hypothetical protein